MRRSVLLSVVVAAVLAMRAGVVAGNSAPVADAGSSRYAGSDSVVLDGTGSFDPDGHGQLTYQWRQVSGPSVTMRGEDTAMLLVTEGHNSAVPVRADRQRRRPCQLGRYDRGNNSPVFRRAAVATGERLRSVEADDSGVRRRQLQQGRAHVIQLVVAR